MAVGDQGTIAVSPDGTTWTDQTPASPFTLRSVRFLNGLFVAVGDEGTILTSPDGTDWTSPSLDTPHAFQDVAFGDGFFVAVGVHPDTLDGVIFTSPDGIDWTFDDLGPLPELSAIAITFGQEEFLAGGPQGALLSSP